MKPPRPWEQQPHESAKAFAAFKQYCEQGPSRSIRLLGAEQGRGAPTVLHRWSAAHDWQERGRAFDAHLNELATKAEEKAIEAGAGRWLECVQQLRKQEWDVAQRLITKAQSILDQLEDQPGTIGEAARLMDLASKLGRLACGVATEPEQSGAGGGQQQAVVIQIPSNGRDDE